MANFVQHISCEACGSSDANALYDDQSTYCFSCEAYGESEEGDLEDFAVVESVKAPSELRGFRERQLTKEAVGFYGVTVKVSQNEIVEHWYPYANGAYKIRTVANKEFKAIDFKKPGLFGQELWSSGKKLVITEGELDAIAVQQAFITKYGKTFPVVSVPNGAQGAAKAILRQREWVRGFDEVILMFDQDAPGQAAVNECAKIIGADIVRIASLKTKDPCDELLAHGALALDQAVWNASQWQPAGIINGADAWDEYLTEKEAVYQEFPGFLDSLNTKVHGVRAGSITMLTSGTGCGKTTFVKEFIYHILKTTSEQIGLVSLEESVAETVRGFISMDLNKRVGLPGVEVEMDEERAAFDRTLGTGRILMLDHQGSCEDSGLLDKLEFLALSGCKYIVLDHITIAVSETSDGNTNQAIDALMSSLLKITKRHDCHITCISHLRKVSGGDKSFEDGGDISMDDLRGSGSLKQISAQVIALSRNLSAESELERHTVKIKVLKDRWTGNTGWAGSYRFNQQTGRLETATVNEEGFSVLED